MTQKPNNGYAPGVTITPMVDQGMSLRDYFAGQALAHGYTHVKGEDTPTDIAADAYAIADAMIAARKGGAQ